MITKFPSYSKILCSWSEKHKLSLWNCQAIMTWVRWYILNPFLIACPTPHLSSSITPFTYSYPYPISLHVTWTPTLRFSFATNHHFYYLEYFNSCSRPCSKHSRTLCDHQKNVMEECFLSLFITSRILFHHRVGLKWVVLLYTLFRPTSKIPWLFFLHCTLHCLPDSPAQAGRSLPALPIVPSLKAFLPFQFQHIKASYQLSSAYLLAEF